ncbi:MAG: AzlC family ABC transporter permease [Acidimicrobiia bacterium]|nr:AzlC family ABC transporter permease [Acidimicrobiia bacterium]
MSNPADTDGSAGARAPEPRLADYATLAFTYFTVGVTVSVAMVDAGVSIPTTLGAALVVYSATSELAFLAVKDGGGSTLIGVLSGWLVASRFGLLAVSLGARYRGPLTERIAAAINSFDPNVGLAVQQFDRRRLRRVFWQVTAALMIGWWVGSILGAFLGDLIGDGRAWGLDAVFPAALVAIIGSVVRRRDGLTAALSGAAICCGLIVVAPGGLPILASSLGAVLALVAVSTSATAVTSSPPQEPTS